MTDEWEELMQHEWEEFKKQRGEPPSHDHLITDADRELLGREIAYLYTDKKGVRAWFRWQSLKRAIKRHAKETSL